MMRRLRVVSAMLLAAGCAAPQPREDPTVTIQITNARAEPLQCRMMFGHWVDRDLGTVALVGKIAVEVQQQPADGALYVMRDDGQRRMMVENIFCARPDHWQVSVGQVDLATVRAARPSEVWVSCFLPEDGGHVVCSKPKLWRREP
jgi:hypothetical protein